MHGRPHTSTVPHRIVGPPELAPASALFGVDGQTLSMRLGLRLPTNLKAQRNFEAPACGIPASGIATRVGRTLIRRDWTESRSLSPPQHRRSREAGGGCGAACHNRCLPCFMLACREALVALHRQTSDGLLGTTSKGPPRRRGPCRHSVARPPKARRREHRMPRCGTHFAGCGRTPPKVTRRWTPLQFGPGLPFESRRGAGRPPFAQGRSELGVGMPGCMKQPTLLIRAQWPDVPCRKTTATDLLDLDRRSLGDGVLRGR